MYAEYCHDTCSLLCLSAHSTTAESTSIHLLSNLCHQRSMDTAQGPPLAYFQAKALHPLKKACFKWRMNRDLPHTLARNPGSSVSLSWVVIVSRAALSLISKDVSVDGVGNDLCVLYQSPQELWPRTTSSQGYLAHKKAVPSAGGSCSREKAECAWALKRFHKPRG